MATASSSSRRFAPSHASDAVVIMLSTEAEIRDRIRGLQTGADEYVGKPYDAGYVVARTQELLQERRRSAASATTVLIIDDSATFREELRSALEAADYAVVTAGTGEEGLRVAASNDRRPSSSTACSPASTARPSFAGSGLMPRCATFRVCCSPHPRG